METEIRVRTTKKNERVITRYHNFENKLTMVKITRNKVKFSHEKGSSVFGKLNPIIETAFCNYNWEKLEECEEIAFENRI